MPAGFLFFLALMRTNSGIRILVKDDTAIFLQMEERLNAFLLL